jgi:hypothetical protein
MNVKKKTFLIETLTALLLDKARIGTKHYSVTISVIELNNLINEIKSIVVSE